MRRLLLLALLCGTSGCFTILFHGYDRCQKKYDEAHGEEVAACHAIRDRIDECREGLPTQPAPSREPCTHVVSMIFEFEVCNYPDPPLTPEQAAKQDKQDAEQDEQHDNEFREHCTYLVRATVQACDYPGDQCGPRPFDF